MVAQFHQTRPGGGILRTEAASQPELAGQWRAQPAARVLCPRSGAVGVTPALSRSPRGCLPLCSACRGSEDAAWPVLSGQLGQSLMTTFLTVTARRRHTTRGRAGLRMACLAAPVRCRTERLTARAPEPRAHLLGSDEKAGLPGSALLLWPGARPPRSVGSVGSVGSQAAAQPPHRQPLGLQALPELFVFLQGHEQFLL